MSELSRRAPAASPSTTVLVVDDEALIRTLIARWLKGAGLGVVEAASGGAAMELLADATRTIDVLVTDLAMPGMNGAELIAWAARHRPELPILCMTGHAEGVPPGIPVLDKPFRGPAFLDAVRDALARRPSTTRARAASAGL